MSIFLKPCRRYTRRCERHLFWLQLTGYRTIVLYGNVGNHKAALLPDTENGSLVSSSQSLTFLAKQEGALLAEPMLPPVPILERAGLLYQQLVECPLG